MPNPNQDPNNGVVAVAQTPEEIEAAALAAAEETAKGGQPGEGETQDGDQVVYTEEFDLGNGQKATFEAASPEELRAKIVDAYKTALAGQPATVQPGSPAQPAAPATATQPAVAAPPAKKGRALTTDEEFAIEQDIKTGKPLAAIEKFLETKYGLSPADLAEVSESVNTTKQIRKIEREQAAVTDFRKKHPEYPPISDSSSALVRSYLNNKGAEATVETLEEAYAHLGIGNLLVPAAAPGAATQPVVPAPGTQPGNVTKPAAATVPANGQPVKKVTASGIFGKPGAATRPAADKGAKKPLTDAEMTKIAKEQGSDALLAALEEQHKAGVNG